MGQYVWTGWSNWENNEDYHSWYLSAVLSGPGQTFLVSWRNMKSCFLVKFFWLFPLDWLWMNTNIYSHKISTVFFPHLVLSCKTNKKNCIPLWFQCKRRARLLINQCLVFSYMLHIMHLLPNMNPLRNSLFWFQFNFIKLTCHILKIFLQEFFFSLLFFM